MLQTNSHNLTRLCHLPWHGYVTYPDTVMSLTVTWLCHLPWHGYVTYPDTVMSLTLTRLCHLPWHGYVTYPDMVMWLTLTRLCHLPWHGYGRNVHRFPQYQQVHGLWPDRITHIVHKITCHCVHAWSMHSHLHPQTQTHTHTHNHTQTQTQRTPTHPLTCTNKPVFADVRLQKRITI